MLLNDCIIADISSKHAASIVNRTYIMKTLQEQAYEIGFNAVKNGQSGIWSQNPDACNLLNGNPVGHPDNMPTMKAFSKGVFDASEIQPEPEVVELEAPVKVTIAYKTEMFGNVAVFEAHLHKYGTEKYAQYDKAPFVVYVMKGKRKLCRIRQSYNPFICIMEGWNLELNSEHMELTSSVNPKIKVMKSKYSSFDPRYVSDFESMLKSKNIKPLKMFK